ncbi:helix-turn-helix transcriptional regulator [Dickeya zeae]|uniref:helix-turn-helix transcriptional regulator n=1 Tax=Dickeya zeae TaxID=204042 RepID=UPI00206D79C4|nr:AraC family transcriptional regulator [Dickeya zeae]UPT56623.1 helix-turn-helix transcriptional regulator [Dickeya zeae]
MTDRKVMSRAGVGSAAHVLQTQPLLARHITIDEPTIILIRNGTKRIRWVGNEIELTAGDAVVVGEGQSFDIINTPAPENGTYEADWLSFNSDVVTGYHCRHSGCVKVNQACSLEGISETFRKAFYHTTEVFSEPALIPDTVARDRMHEMLSWLEEYGVCFGVRFRTGIESKLRRLISVNLSHSWDIKTVASQLGMSEATLRRKLAAEQTSFSKLIADVRMCRALTLLQVTDLSVTQIAFEVGYESPSKFSSRFRHRFGFYPGQVRTKEISAVTL